MNSWTRDIARGMLAALQPCIMMMMMMMMTYVVIQNTEYNESFWLETRARGMQAAPGSTCYGQQMGENCKKIHAYSLSVLA